MSDIHVKISYFTGVLFITKVIKAVSGLSVTSDSTGIILLVLGAF